MGRQTEVSWDAIKTYFITQTGHIADNTESLRSVAKRYGISAAALSRKANKPDENGDTWFDLRDRFVKKSMTRSGADSINKVVTDINRNRKVLSLMSKIAIDQINDIMKNPEEYDRFKKSLTVRDISNIIKLATDIDLRLVEIYKQGLTKKNMSLKVNLNLDGVNNADDLKNLTKDQLRKIKDQIDNFQDADYEIIEED